MTAAKMRSTFTAIANTLAKNVFSRTRRFQSRSQIVRLEMFVQKALRWKERFVIKFIERVRPNFFKITRNMSIMCNTILGIPLTPLNKLETFVWIGFMLIVYWPDSNPRHHGLGQNI